MDIYFVECVQVLRVSGVGEQCLGDFDEEMRWWVVGVGECVMEVVDEVGVGEIS